MNIYFYLHQDTLFPYVRKNVSDFLSKKFEDAGVQKAVAALRDLVCLVKYYAPFLKTKIICLVFGQLFSTI